MWAAGQLSDSGGPLSPLPPFPPTLSQSTTADLIVCPQDGGLGLEPLVA